MMKALGTRSHQPYSAGLYSVAGWQKLMSGGKYMADVISGNGVIEYGGEIISGTNGNGNRKHGLPEEVLKAMLGHNHSTSLLTDTYVSLLEAGMHRSKTIGTELRKSEYQPNTVFDCSARGSNILAHQFKQVSKLIKDTPIPNPHTPPTDLTSVEPETSHR